MMSNFFFMKMKKKISIQPAIIEHLLYVMRIIIIFENHHPLSLVFDIQEFQIFTYTSIPSPHALLCMCPIILLSSSPPLPPQMYSQIDNCSPYFCSSPIQSLLNTTTHIILLNLSPIMSLLCSELSSSFPYQTE